MNRRQALKSIILAPLGLYFLGGVRDTKTATRLPKLFWYQTPHRFYTQGSVCKIGLKAIWPDGSKFGYTAAVWDVPEKPNILSQGEMHPNYMLAKRKLIQAAFGKEKSTWSKVRFAVAGPKTVWRFL